MTCSACGRANLPGGVRCIYCGTPLPPSLEFDLGAPVASAAGSDADLETEAAPAGQRGRSAGLIGTLLLLVLKGKSLLSLLKFGKIATTLVSMAVFIWADALLFGWKFGVGIALSILVHELGHVVVNWSKGLKQTAPMFIPFVGAVIFIKQFPDDPTVQSESGAGGPAAGFLAALVCLGVAHVTGSPFWLALAHIGFLINLFNLIPFPPLDGSHIAAVFSPGVWGAVLVGMLLWVLKSPSATLWMVLLVGFLFRLGRADDGRHLLAPPTVRARMALIYLALCIGLSWGAEHTTAVRPALRGRAANVTRIAPAEPAANAARPAPAPEQKADAEGSPWPRRAALVTVAALLWLLIARLLAAADGRRLDARGLSLAAGMCAVPLLLYAGFDLLALPGPERSTLIGAYLAATGAALFYAGYQSVRRRTHPGGVPSGVFPLTVRCLAWACAGALLVAYATDDWLVAGATAVCALAYYARFPSVAVALAGSLAETLGDPQRSIALRRRALTLGPEPEAADALRTHIARLHLLLDRGGGALEMLPPEDATLVDLERRAAALALLDRYDEALACCERILQAPLAGGDGPGDRSGPLRLLAARLRLARIAQFRGWPDEALAQADWCLRALPKTAKSLVARLHALRADALIALNNVEAARAACEEALTASREPSVQASVAAVRAQACLRAGDGAGAERETSLAMRLLPGHLAFRYWRGRALVANGKMGSGKVVLDALAADYPNEHWGRRARE